MRTLETFRYALCPFVWLLPVNFALFTTPFLFRGEFDEIQSIKQQMKMATRTSSSESGERYASLAYERLVRSVWEESGSRSAAARAAHETAKRMTIVRLEKSIMGWGNDPRCLGERRTSLRHSVCGCTLAVLPEPQIVHRWMR